MLLSVGHTALQRPIIVQVANVPRHGMLRWWSSQGRPGGVLANVQRWCPYVFARRALFLSCLEPLRMCRLVQVWAAAAQPGAHQQPPLHRVRPAIIDQLAGSEGELARPKPFHHLPCRANQFTGNSGAAQPFQQ